MSSFLLFKRVYRLEIQSVTLVFLTPLVNCCPYTFSLTSPTSPPFPKVNVQYEQTVCGCGGWVLCCVVDHIVQEFNSLFQNLQNFYTTLNKNDQ
jgi:hypothetical protein